MAENQTKKICVVGAGPSGICALYAFKDIPNLEVVCYEKQADFGGMWVYNEAFGKDPRGEVIPSCMYKGLWTNGPKECLELPQFPYEEAFNGVNLPTMISREVMLRYLRLFSEKNGLEKFCTFDTTVENVKWSDETQKFTVEVRNCTSKEITSSNFDYVCVCTGHFCYPNIPDAFPGQETFPGTIIHASQMRDNVALFKGKRVLSVGGSYSAESLVMESVKAGCTYVTNTYRTNATHLFDNPEISGGKADEHPLITKIEGSTVTFGDDVSKDFDIIVWATGYKHEFPFMDDPLRLRTANLMYVDGLYKGVVFQDRPEVFYIGAQDLFYTFTFFMNQALWIAGLLTGKVKLPSLEEQKAHTKSWMDRLPKLETDDDYIKFQGAHADELGNDIGAPAMNTDDVFIAWEHDRHENMFTHRDCQYTSIFQSKVTSAKPTKPWMECQHPVDYIGLEKAEAIKMNDWIESVGGVKY